MSKKLNIGISGTRGIPNRYGGFEQCAEKLAQGLVAKGHRVTVYNSSDHEYQLSEWNGVQIVHCKDMEKKLGTFGQFIYDLNCFRDARRRDFDVLLQLGYTSSAVWYPYWPKKYPNVINMDGLEWKRSKFSRKVQWFLKHSERWAARHGDLLVADSLGIQQHLRETYDKPSAYIPYGAEVFTTPDAAVPGTYGLQPGAYHLLIARMEPENNIETIIKGYLRIRGKRVPLVIVGRTDNAFGTYLVNTYGQQEGVRFLGAIFDTPVIDSLRYYSYLYFHGHSVGGTNPSLLEAMGCSALIAIHDNIFNRSIIGTDGFIFSGEEEVVALIEGLEPRTHYRHWIDANVRKIQELYSWPRIVDAYEAAFLQVVESA